jgi:AmmeMemoRadiSam system protein A
MARMSLIKSHQHILLQLAKQSIANGLAVGEPLTVKAQDYAPELQERKATFVTLTIHEQLRGCIGTLVATRPLVEDVTQQAYAAAFADWRFPPLRREEYSFLGLHISILNHPEPVQFQSEEDLLRQLQPGIDGLILNDGWHRATFLPSVWESLKEPRDFLRHLKQKAGLPANYWSATLTVQRYTTESIQQDE